MLDTIIKRCYLPNLPNNKSTNTIIMVAPPTCPKQQYSLNRCNICNSNSTTMLNQAAILVIHAYALIIALLKKYQTIITMYRGGTRARQWCQSTHLTSRGVNEVPSLKPTIHLARSYNSSRISSQRFRIARAVLMLKNNTPIKAVASLLQRSKGKLTNMLRL